MPVRLLPCVSSHEPKDDENDQTSVPRRFAWSCRFRRTGLRFHEERRQGDTITTASVSTQESAADAADVDARRPSPRPQPATSDAVIVRAIRIATRPGQIGRICGVRRPPLRGRFALADETDRSLARSSVTAKQVFASDGEATWQNPHANMILIRPSDRIPSIPLRRARPGSARAGSADDRRQPRRSV